MVSKSPLNSSVSPKSLKAPFLKKIEDKYGKIDMENDFFNKNLTRYYKTTSTNDITGSVEHKLYNLPKFTDSFKMLFDTLKSIKKSERQDIDLASITELVKDAFTKYRTFLRKYYPDQYNAIKGFLREMNTTGGGGGAATFTGGTGAQYATPKAFNKNKNAKGSADIYYYKLGYKRVPDKIKGSGIEVKKIFEEEMTKVKEFHNLRESAFDKIEEKLSNLNVILSNAKNETVEYYQTNPQSYEVVYPTDLIMDYINDIEELLNID